MTEFSSYDNREYARPEFKFIDEAVDGYLKGHPQHTVPANIDHIAEQIELEIVVNHPDVIGIDEDHINLVHWIKRSLETKILYRKKQI